MIPSNLSYGFHFEGHTIALRRPRESDVTEGVWSSWYNDLSITKYNTHGVYPVSIDNELKYINERLDRPDCLIFAVVNKNSEELIGNASLQNIDFINRKADIALTIGKPLGISTAVEVHALLLDHAFSRLNLNRVAGATHEKLSPLVKMLTLCGFKEEGRSKEFFFRDGFFYDSIHFGALSKDFFSLKQSRNGKILFDELDALNAAIVTTMK